MSETNESQARRPTGSKPLSLKKTETSTVKQSFSHGRSKAVVVEKKRARVAPAGGKLETPEKPRAVAGAAEVKAPAQDAAAQAREAHRAGVVLRQLTDEEKEARRHALADARVAEEEARKHAEEDARHRAVEEARLAKERAAAEKRKAEEEARKQAEEVARKHAEEEASRRLEKKDEPATAEAPRRSRPVVEEEEEAPKKGAKAPAKTPTARKGADIRRRGKLTVTAALSDSDERMRSVASYRRHLQRVNKAGQQQPAGPAGPREVTIPETISVAELANRMARRAVDVIKVLMKNGMMATVNDVIDADTAELVATEYGHTVRRVAESDVLEGLRGQEDDAANLLPRPAKRAASPSISAPIRCG
jgi:translation initiation factor IF-2